VTHIQSKHTNLFILQNQAHFRLIYSHHLDDYKHKTEIFAVVRIWGFEPHCDLQYTTHIRSLGNKI